MRRARSPLRLPLYAALGFFIAAAFFHVRPAAAAPLRAFFDSFAARFLRAAVTGTDAVVAAEQEARIRVLEEENAVLRRDGAIVGSSALPKAFGRVLWYDPDPARRTVRMLIPESVAVHKGDAVVAAGEILVGKVTEVYGRSADVLLIDDPAFRVSATAGKEIGVAEGDGRGAMNLRFLPRDHGIVEGVPVRTAGEEGDIPKGLLIGWAAPRASDPASPFADVGIVAATDLDALGLLMVIPLGR